jgi:hypothetical protein
MDEVVQRTAANAEELAGASDMINDQAADMRKDVAQLEELVDGNRKETQEPEKSAKTGKIKSSPRQKVRPAPNMRTTPIPPSKSVGLRHRSDKKESFKSFRPASVKADFHRDQNSRPS